jgi:hypothetical protein
MLPQEKPVAPKNVENFYSSFFFKTIVKIVITGLGVIVFVLTCIYVRRKYKFRTATAPPPLQSNHADELVE